MKAKSVIWGLILVAVGAVLALNAVGLTNIDVFFDGWWTLFLIVPCAAGLFSAKDKTGNLIGLGIGVILLLACQNVIRLDLVWKLIFPVMIVAIGLRLIFKDTFNRKSREAVRKLKEQGIPMREYCATFSGQDLDFTGETFRGAELNAIFGGVKCDLRTALIPEDAVIDACSVFGGIDIYVPEDVNVKITSNSIFGGVSNKRKKQKTEGGVTVYINGSCIFGGVDVK
ncbi:MAG: LiaF transmembrane domain-containing protein [Faecousia sp.]